MYIHVYRHLSVSRHHTCAVMWGFSVSETVSAVAVETHSIVTVSVTLAAFEVCPVQGFMQDQIIASHTCFGGQWMLTVKPVYKLKNVPDDMRLTINIHMTPFTLTSKA